MNDKPIMNCYAFSKMSVLDEMETPEKFERMTFSEFLEFLARLADFYIEYGELKQKLEALLDIMLPSHQMMRIPVTKDADSDSSVSD